MSGGHNRNDLELTAHDSAVIVQFLSAQQRKKNTRKKANISKQMQKADVQDDDILSILKI